MPALVTSRYVGTKVPVVVLDKLVDKRIDLRRQRTRQETLHGQRCLVGSLACGAGAVVGTLIVESTDSQQIYHLLVHLLLSVDNRAHHLLLVGIYRWHLQVEVNLWCCGLSADVHQAVHADGIAAERVADVQVGKTHAANRINGLQVECCLIGIATKHDGTTAVKRKVLLDDILDGDAVRAVINGVGSKHIKRALVVERCAYRTVTIKGDVILGAFVHQQLQGGVGRGVNLKVDVDIRIVGPRASWARYARLVSNTRFSSWVLPGNKLLIADSIWTGGVIHKHATGLGRYVTIDNHIVAMTADRYVTTCINGAVEG